MSVIRISIFAGKQVCRGGRFSGGRASLRWRRSTRGEDVASPPPLPPAASSRASSMLGPTGLVAVDSGRATRRLPPICLRPRLWRAVRGFPPTCLRPALGVKVVGLRYRSHLYGCDFGFIIVIIVGRVCRNPFQPQGPFYRKMFSLIAASASAASASARSRFRFSCFKRNYSVASASAASRSQFSCFARNTSALSASHCSRKCSKTARRSAAQSPSGRAEQ